jgi:chitin synthase
MQSSQSSNRYRAQYRPLTVAAVSEGEYLSRGSSPAPPYDDYNRQSAASVPPPTASTRYRPIDPFEAQQVRNDTSINASITNSIEVLPPSRLPFFEAALARTRGASNLKTSLERISQPLPTYMPPADPNHPYLEVSMIRSHTIRPAQPDMRQERGLSRSPTPERVCAYLSEDQNEITRPLFDHCEDVGGDKWTHDEKDLDTGDISQIPYIASAMPIIHVQHPTEIMYENAEAFGKLESATQHFGPAPAHRVHRRTHNAAGHRRIKLSICPYQQD